MKKVVVDCTKGTEKRSDLTVAEQEQAAKDSAEAEAVRLAAEAETTKSAAARESAKMKLAALNFTADEIVALLK